MSIPKIRNPLFAATLVLVSVAAYAAPPSRATDSGEKAPEWSESDTSRDGFLSKDELIPYPGVLKRFDEIDTDADGKISESEYMAWLDARKHR